MIWSNRFIIAIFAFFTIIYQPTSGVGGFSRSVIPIYNLQEQHGLFTSPIGYVNPGHFQSILISGIPKNNKFLSNNPLYPDNNKSISFGFFLPENNVASGNYIYLPLILTQNEEYSDPRPTGDIFLDSGPDACDGESCYSLEVTCSQLEDEIGVTLKVGTHSTSTNNGTIVFFSGWDGTYYWEDSVAADMLNRGIDVNSPEVIYAINSNRNILDNLQAAGFQTVQVKWGNNWFLGSPGEEEGMANLACRPATVIKWIHDYLVTQDPQNPFCATGHSNGASQLGYSLSQYGLSNILDDVVMESGPNWARIDQSCLHSDSSLADLFAEPLERSYIDLGFGFPNSGPCKRQESSYLPYFEEASLALGDWPYYYPNSLVSFIFGGDDDDFTAAHGKYYYNYLLNHGSPKLNIQIIPGASHDVTATPEGAEALQNALINGCINQ